MLIVQAGDSGTKRLDTSGRAVFSGSGSYGDGRGTGEAAGDLVVGLGGTLTQIGPRLRIVGVAMLCGAL